VDLDAPGRKLASQRRLAELDFTACYAAYDNNVIILTTAVKVAYETCVALLGAPGGACRKPLSTACTTGLTNCWNTFKADNANALVTAKAALDACINAVKAQLTP
jgi:hypothetical protein